MMKLGRKIKKIKSKFLNFLRKNIHLEIYNFIILQLSKKKFLKSINSKKIILSKSKKLDEINNYEFTYKFVEIVRSAGCNVFIVHARNAILGSLSPKKK